MTDLTNTTTTSLLINSLYPTTGLVALVGCLLGTLTLWTGFGNLLVLISLLRYHRMRTTPNLLIGNLAVSDFLLAITVLPLSAVNDLFGFWPLGQVMCNLWLSFDVFYCTASVWGLVVIAFDRYTATAFPVWYRNHGGGWKRVLPYILFVWLFSCLICIPPLIGWDGKSFVHPLVKFSRNYVIDNGTGCAQCTLFSEPHYVIYSALGSFIIPLAVMILLYTKIFVLMQARAKTKRSKCSLHSQASVVAIRNHNTKQLFEDDGSDDRPERKDGLRPTRGNSESEGEGGVDFLLEGKMADSEDRLLQSSPQYGDSNGMEMMSMLPNQHDNLNGERTDAAGDDNERTFQSQAKRLRRKLLRSNPSSVNSNKKSNSGGDDRSGYQSTTRRMRNFSLYRKRRSDSTANTQMHADKRERRATKRMALIISVFALCWIPFTLMYLSRSLCGDDRCPDLPHPRMFVIWLGYANSGINPILYTLFNEDFRRAFVNVLCGKRRKLLRRLSTITGQSFSI